MEKAEKGDGEGDEKGTWPEMESRAEEFRLKRIKLQRMQPVPDDGEQKGAKNEKKKLTGAGGRFAIVSPDERDAFNFRSVRTRNVSVLSNVKC
ncbi:hypothetical protein DM860_009522 [Cuscuta australis]|uniref:Uncharacterized protein n=1 Tax=Cuscuta australis TaxID=267555 RepID=A0A328DLX7_9ASTE|nr:hypothetical protein DM860_009522 [Cuscuta australis]